MATRHRSDRFPPKIRNLRWTASSTTFLAFSAGTAGLTLLSSGLETATIMRMRGELFAGIDGVQSPGGLTRLGIGALVVPAGTGTTVTTSPLTDTDAPWLFYETFVLGYEEMVVDAIQVVDLSGFRKTIDVKAMRVLRPEREIQLVLESVTLNAAIGVQLSTQIRMLIGQH